MNQILKTSIGLALSFSIGFSEDVTLNIKNGWNLISIPTAITLSNEYFNAESIWIYNGSWQKNPSTITKGQGIWIKSNEKQSLSFSGDSYKQDFLNLKNGWNLLGTGEEVIAPDNIKTVLTYDGSWHKNPSTLKVGEGFWVNTNNISEYSTYIKTSSLSSMSVENAQLSNAINHEEDSDYTTQKTINITLNENSINIDTNGVATISGESITISSGGTYNISGTLNNGQIIVNSNEVVKLILNGVDITSANNSPIYVANATKTIILLADGSSNYLTDASTNQEDGVLFSKDNLTIYGEGTLTVTSNSNDGIRSNDGLIIKSGNINVISIDDGIRAKDYLVIKEANITITSEGDGIKTDSENIEKGYILIENGNFDINSGGDSIKGESDILISGGTFNIKSGGGSGNYNSDVSMKGLKAGIDIVIDNGTFDINSADDSIHSNERIFINSGVFNMSSGDDGIHADTSIEVNGGEFNIKECYEGIESAIILINNGYIQLSSSDDGINVAGGNSGNNMFMPQDGNFTNPNDFGNPMDMNFTNPNPNDGNFTNPNDFGNPMDMNFTNPNPNDGNSTNPNDFGNPMDTNSTNRRPNDGNFMNHPQDNFAVSEDYYLHINGGYIVVNAKGDGLDANGYIKMQDGFVIVNGPIENMNGPIDYDGTFEISGGTLIAVGSAGMAQAPSNSSSQNSLLVRFSAWQNANNLINLQNDLGESLVTFSPAKEYQSFVYSSPSLTTNANYNLYLGGTYSANEEHGLYENGEYSEGSLYTNFTISSIVTSIR